MPKRTYICSLGNGMGNFGHMISRSSGNMALNPEFRKSNPESYILVGGSEEQNKALIDKLSKLDPSHPMHISNLHTADHPAGNIYICPHDNIPHDLLYDAIVYRVSFANSLYLEPDSKGFTVANLQFSWSNRDDPDNPLIRNMGFGPSGYGIFVENKPTTKTINENAAANLTQALLSCADKELARAILGSDVHEAGVQAIKAFHNGEKVLVHLYSHKEDNVNEYIDAIKNSPVMQGKYLVFVVTGKGSLTEEPRQASYDVIKRDYIDQNLYSVINQLKTSDIAFPSGDKSFEETISAGAVPIIFGLSSFSASCDNFIAVIERMKVDETNLEQHKKAVEFLRASDMSKNKSFRYEQKIKLANARTS